MNGDFKPLRRKIGVVTLVLACLFAAGWVRSTISVDMLYFGRGGVAYVLRSGYGRLEFTSRVFDGEPFWTFRSKSIASEREVLESKLRALQRPVHDVMILVRSKASPSVPYWSIVIPLTALSAWLLLSKPRVKKPSATAPAE